jgi:lipopolysaccharide core galacturonosyltransferase RgtB
MIRRPLEQQGRFFLIALVGYFTLHVVLRVFISPSLDFDEAEQALLSQWLLPGYTEQPPLYTWIQYLLFLVFGKSVFAISLLKNTLLLLTYLFVFLVARKVMTSERLAMLAALSLLLIPQIGWESQRDMTHTTLAVLAAAATLWQVLRLLKRQSLGDYLLLGVILAVGVLSKANYLLFTSVLLITLGSFTEGRRVIFHRYMLLALALAIALPSAYLLWMTDNRDIVFSATHKFKRATEAFWYKGPSSLVTKIFFFLTPLWLILLLIFPQGFRRTNHTAAMLPQRFLQRLLLFLAIALLLVVLVGKVTYVKDRWLQPLLFIVPIVFFARLDQQAVSERRYLLFFRVVGIAALAVYAAFTLRVIAASHSGSFCRLNYPFGAFAVDLRNLGFDQGIVVSDDRFVAGNLHLQFPESPAVIPDYRLEKQLDSRPHKQLAVVWHAAQSPTLPENLREYLASAFALRVDEAKIHVLSQPYLFGRGETIALAVILLPLPPPPEGPPPA